MAELSAIVQEAQSVDAALEAAMFRLYERYYGASSETAFRRDLRSKDRIILLRDPMTVLEPGFWLSFLSAGAILFILATSRPGRGWRKWWGVQLSLSLLMAPLT